MESMNLTPEAVAKLLTATLSGPVVTIYMPTHRAATSPNISEDQIRFRNLFHQAIKQLEGHPASQSVLETLHQAMQTIDSNVDFWKDQTEGLLFCANGSSLSIFHLPIETEEHVSINHSYYLAPIFGMLADMQSYYVLSVAQHHPALFYGDDYGLKDAGITLPKSLELGLQLDEMTQGSEQQRSSGSQSGYNGRGGSKDPADAERLHFWRMMDDILRSQADTKLPLILAGVQSELTEYRSISKYPTILNSDIVGNHSDDTTAQLFTAAQLVIRHELSIPSHQAAIDRYTRAKGQTPDQVAYELKAIRQAAERGQIDTLLIPAMHQTTDSISDNTDSVSILSFPTSESSQEVDEITAMVWNSSGRVVDIAPEQMPEQGALLLATLRY